MGYSPLTNLLITNLLLTSWDIPVRCPGAQYGGNNDVTVCGKFQNYQKKGVLRISEAWNYYELKNPKTSKWLKKNMPPGGGFGYCLFLPLPGEMIQCDLMFFNWVEATNLSSIFV